MTSGNVCVVEVLREIPGIGTVVEKELAWLV